MWNSLGRVWRAISPGAGAARSVFAVADQGVVSGASFSFNLILARILSEREFGVAVLSIGGLYLLQGVHRSLIIYPLSLRIASGPESDTGRLTFSAALLSLPLSMGLGFVAAAAAMLMSH